MVKPLAPEERRWVVETMLSCRLPPGFSLENWTANPEFAFADLDGGDVFVLGGRSLEAFAVPGHSPGSLAFLERPAGRLFTGDSVLPKVWLHLEESAPLSAYLAGLRRLPGLAFGAIFPSHGHEATVPLPRAILDELAEGVARIVSDELVGRTECTFIGEGLYCDFGSCGVVYRPDRL